MTFLKSLWMIAGGVVVATVVAAVTLVVVVWLSHGYVGGIYFQWALLPPALLLPVIVLFCLCAKLWPDGNLCHWVFWVPAGPFCAILLLLFFLDFLLGSGGGRFGSMREFSPILGLPVVATYAFLCAAMAWDGTWKLPARKPKKKKKRRH